MELVSTVFTATEIASLANALQSNTDLTIRINKCGNIDVAHKKSIKEHNSLHFVFYKRGKNEYFVRRRLGFGSGLAQVGTIMNGNKTFKTMKSMVQYFSHYCEKYPTHLYTTFEK